GGARLLVGDIGLGPFARERSCRQRLPLAKITSHDNDLVIFESLPDKRPDRFAARRGLPFPLLLVDPVRFHVDLAEGHGRHPRRVRVAEDMAALPARDPPNDKLSEQPWPVLLQLEEASRKVRSLWRRHRFRVGEPEEPLELAPRPRVPE